MDLMPQDLSLSKALPKRLAYLPAHTANCYLKTFTRVLHYKSSEINSLRSQFLLTCSNFNGLTIILSIGKNSGPLSGPQI